ncbi:MAG TPA: hypothetical protein VNM87_11070, partial [Candidatus Udaeobacter sp.]|nr:hypothetical protein [Candidatus Udaeobacter sp.]
MPEPRTPSQPAAAPRLLIGLLALSAVVLLTALAFAPPVVKPAKLKRTSGAMAAMDLWAAARAYPGRVIPDVGQAAAYEYS